MPEAEVWEAQEVEDLPEVLACLDGGRAPLVDGAGATASSVRGWPFRKRSWKRSGSNSPEIA